MKETRRLKLGEKVTVYLENVVHKIYLSSMMAGGKRPTINIQKETEITAKSGMFGWSIKVH
ncbi:MAG: hypothetical protein IJT54_08045 [Candidatus Methanomethylophilaceae archaeon]|nr:hypothetical protein [Candidatus Methanomethylophilaceae archaeon]